jgi:Fe-Mn family superoxide dismutase
MAVNLNATGVGEWPIASAPAIAHQTALRTPRSTLPRRHVAPITCKAWALNGLSERLIVSHYENIYGPAVRSLNAIRDELDALDTAAAPACQIRALKRDEAVAACSVALHELYFGSLGGDGAVSFTGSGPGSKIPSLVEAALEQHFGSVAAWRREFIVFSHALTGCSGWVLLRYARGDGRLSNQIAFDLSPGMIDALPVIALDIYEHAYYPDFGANAFAYVDAFMRNIDWATVADRLTELSENSSPRPANVTDDSLPSLSVEALSAEIAKGEQIQVLDARPKHYFSRSPDMIRGAIWRDPDRLDEWWKDLSADAPVFVYCAYGYYVSQGVTAALRERGFDAKYIRGGLSAWYAAGGARAIKHECQCNDDCLIQK